MRIYILIIGFILYLNNTMNGHTGYADTVKCPVCGNAVFFHLTARMTSFGGYLDFQKQGAIGYYYEEMINSCKKCYFSGYRNDFDTTFTATHIDSIKAVTYRYMEQKLDNALECEIAADIKMISNFEYIRIANIYLIGSYLLRKDTVQAERRKELQTKTAEFLIKALENNEYEKDMMATINYLIGEMYRRTGNFNEAIKHYDLAIEDENKKEWVKDVAIKQKELAINNDDNNEI